MNFSEVFEKLNITEEELRNIITDDGAKESILNCLQNLISNVPDMAELASCLMQYILMDDRSAMDGGPGSGNFGHEGVPGQVGGSAPSDGASETSSPVSENTKKIVDKLKEKSLYSIGTEDRKELIDSLEKDGFEITQSKDEEYYGTYTAFSEKSSCQENQEINKLLHGYGTFSMEDYIKRCKEKGTQPDLHFKPEEVNPYILMDKKGNILKDDTPVYSMYDQYDALSNGELIKYSGTDGDISPELAKKQKEISKKAISEWSDSEAKAVREYTQQYGGITSSAINSYLLTGEGSDDVKEAAKDITSALDHEIGVDCITFRGAETLASVTKNPKIQKLISKIEKCNFASAGEIKKELEGTTVENPAVMSTSMYSASSGYNNLPVQMIFKTPAKAKAVDISGASVYGEGASEASKALEKTGLFGSIAKENEVAYKPNTKFIIDRVEFSVKPVANGKKQKNVGQVFLICSVLPDDRKDSIENEDDWVTMKGTHVFIDEEGSVTKGPENIKRSVKSSEAKSETTSTKSESSDKWSSSVKERRNELLNQEPSEVANEMYDSGVLSLDAAVEQMNNGDIYKTAEKYFDILESNGDPTPTKKTQQQYHLTDKVNNEYGGDWKAARFGEIKKNTGVDDDTARKYQDELGVWFGSSWDAADTKIIDDFVEHSPAYDGEIYRGMHFDDEYEAEIYDTFMETVKSGVITMGKNSSWSSNEEVARNFSHSSWDESDSVFIKCLKNKTAVPCEYLASTNGGEMEVLAHSKTAWSVLSVEEYTTPAGGRKATVTVIERGEYDK